EDIIVYSSDTDFTPFDKGAYASSTTYVSGAAVTKAAEEMAEKIKTRAKMIFDSQNIVVAQPEIDLINGNAVTPDGHKIPLSEIALDSLHKHKQEQLMTVASFGGESSPPPFGVQFATVL